MKRTLTLVALLSLSSAAFAPLPAMAQPRVDVVINAAPPPPRFERVPSARRGYLWSPGRWQWDGRRYYWAAGAWLAERPGYVYSAPVWFQDHGRWQMRPAGWARGGPEHFDRPRDDRNHDGIPDRMERPRGEHERDHDRDHDGVPNRDDRAPNDARRN